MNNSVRTVLIVAGAVVLLSAAFYGGIAFQGAKGEPVTGALAANGAGRGMGGPMANLTEEEQAELEGMTDEERQAFLQEKFGDQMPSGTAPNAAGRGMGGGLTEGEVIEVEDDAITIKLASGSSLTVYTDDDTIIARADGASDLEVGSSVLVAATPEADGVTTASVIVVKP